MGERAPQPPPSCWAPFPHLEDVPLGRNLPAQTGDSWQKRKGAGWLPERRSFGFRQMVPAPRGSMTREDAAHELPNLLLEDALQLVHLYA